MCQTSRQPVQAATACCFQRDATSARGQGGSRLLSCQGKIDPLAAGGSENSTRCWQEWVRRLETLRATVHHRLKR